MNKRKTRIQYHRKKEGKTNYKKRLALLKSGQDRLVIRRSNKFVTAQIVRYEPDGDKVILGVNSKQLEKHGWKYSGKNIPACYLTGYLLGKKAVEMKLKSAILDLGLQTPIPRSRLYAVLKGVVDHGVNVPCSEDIFPEDERVLGNHISEKMAKDFEGVKAKLK